MKAFTKYLVILGFVHVIQAELCFEVQEEMALFLNNDKVYRHVSLEACKTLCEQETTFSCMSFDHTTSQTCYLSKSNHETAPNMLGKHQSAVYGYVIPCDDETEDNGSGSGSGSGQGEQETNDMRFRFYAGEGRSRKRRETSHVLSVDLKTLVDKSGRRKVAGLA